MNQQISKFDAHPARIIPFDLGRTLSSKDIDNLNNHLSSQYTLKELSTRQKSILKNCILIFSINSQVDGFIFKNGLCVVVIEDEIIDLRNDFTRFSIIYGEKRKKAHSDLFNWTHSHSNAVDTVIRTLRDIVKKNTQKKDSLRKSSSAEFENRGLSYVMTLSFFDMSDKLSGFENYPQWLKNNLHALLNPALLYLEDSNKFSTENKSHSYLEKLLNEMRSTDVPHDFEHHSHIDTYMSWSAVIAIGQLLASDREEYIALEVQLQSDWYYVYCLEKDFDESHSLSKQKIIEIQRLHYDLELLENRLLDFDDTSLPTRVLNLQKGMVETSAITKNILHLQKKLQFLLEREQLNNEMKQKKLAQSSEILLFIITCIELAPTLTEYGNKLFPYAGIMASCLVFLIGLILLIRKN